MTNKQAISLKTNTNDEFGCCHLYRECSIAKYCVRSSEEASAGCAYKKHLEAGHIFYSKNAKSFSMDRYNTLSEKYRDLDSQLKQVFDYLLHYFVVDKRLLPREAFRRTPEINALITVGLLAEERDMPHSHLSSFPYAYLKSLLTDEKSFMSYKDDYLRLYPETEQKYKTPMIHFTVEKDLNALVTFYKENIFVKMEPNEHACYEELYIDNAIERSIDKNGYNLFIYHTLPLLAESFKDEYFHRIELLADQSPFNGSKFVITGVFRKYEREQAHFLIREFGGTTSGSAVKDMDFLVVGYQEWSAMNIGIPSGKITKTAQWIDEGKDIKIIDEEEFYRMLDICFSIYGKGVLWRI